MSSIEIDMQSQLVRVAASTQLSEVERTLQSSGLTLALPEAVYSMTVGAWIEAGTPGIQSPDDDPVQHCIVAIQAELANGVRIETRPAPRRAIGPDLVLGCFVGVGSEVGKVTSAHLSARPTPEKSTRVAFSFSAESVRLEFVAWARGQGIRALRVHVNGANVCFELAGLAALVDVWTTVLGDEARLRGAKNIDGFETDVVPRKSRHELLGGIASELKNRRTS